MLIISHRGNMEGPYVENHIGIIKRQMIDYPDPKLFFEVDVWWWRDVDHTDKFMIGHDKPMYRGVDIEFLTNPKIICHAKNLQTFQRLLQIQAHCFLHDKDEAALTSRGWIWKYPEILNQDGTLAGICTDYAKEFLFSLRQ